MICRMHAFLERFEAGQWNHVPAPSVLPPSHALFSWLGGVRHGIAPHVTPLADRRCLPGDMSWPVTEAYATLQESAFAMSWVTVQELLDFDYDAVVTDLRPAYASPDRLVHYHELLGQAYLEQLAKLSRVGPGRIVFWFELVETPDDNEEEMV